MQERPVWKTGTFNPMQITLFAEIDDTFYHGLHSGIRKEAKQRGLPTDSEEAVAVLLGEPDRHILLDLHLLPILRHAIGVRPWGAFNFPLAYAPERILRRCGGIFAPNTYHVAGDILRLADLPKKPSDNDSEDRYELIVNCGLPVDLSQKRRSNAPHLNRSKLTDESWVAAIGRLAAWPAERGSPYSIRARILSAPIFDLDPYSATFGTVIPWNFLQTRQVDPDVVSIPTLFLTLQVVGDET